MTAREYFRVLCLLFVGTLLLSFWHTEFSVTGTTLMTQFNRQYLGVRDTRLIFYSRLYLLCPSILFAAHHLLLLAALNLLGLICVEIWLSRKTTGPEETPGPQRKV